MVMKRWGDSKAFIPLIRVIFILLAGMAMTGCATSTALTTAAYKGQADVVKNLLDKGADVNERGGCGFGWPSVTPLICAAYGGHMEAVKELIDRGADVNKSDGEGWTPLVQAVDEGHVGITKLLIEKGADIEGALAKLKKNGRKDGYELLERIVKEQRQTPKYQVAPTTLPTALPLPTESNVPF
jgi:hypothetical protein